MLVDAGYKHILKFFDINNEVKREIQSSESIILEKLVTSDNNSTCTDEIELPNTCG